MITRGRLKTLQRENARRRLESTIASDNTSIVPTSTPSYSETNGDIDRAHISQNTEDSGDITDPTQITCGICFTHFTDDSESPKATLDTCNYHLFCLPCIVRWAAQCTRCPLCRVRFESVFVLDKPESQGCLREVIGDVEYNCAVADRADERMTEKKGLLAPCGGKKKRVSLVPMKESGSDAAGTEMLEIKFKLVDFSDFEPGYEFDDLMSNDNYVDEDNLTGDDFTTESQGVNDNDENSSEEEEGHIESRSTDGNNLPSKRESDNGEIIQETNTTSIASSFPVISANDRSGQQIKTEEDNTQTPIIRENDEAPIKISPIGMSDHRRVCDARAASHPIRRSPNTLRPPSSVVIPVGGNAFDGRVLTGYASPHLALHHSSATLHSSPLSLSERTSSPQMYAAPRVIRVKRERYCDTYNIANTADTAVNPCESNRLQGTPLSRVKAPTATSTRVRDLLSRINDPSSTSSVVRIPSHGALMGSNVPSTVAILQDNRDGLAELDRRKGSGGQYGINNSKVSSFNGAKRPFPRFGGGCSAANSTINNSQLSEEEEYAIVYNNTLSALRSNRRINECGPKFDSFGNMLRVTVEGLQRGHVCDKNGGLTAAESIKRDNILKKQASEAARAAIQLRKSKRMEIDAVRKTKEEAIQIRREELALMKMRALLIAAKARRITAPG